MSGVVKHNPSIPRLEILNMQSEPYIHFKSFQYSAAQTPIAALQSVAVTSVMMATSFKPFGVQEPTSVLYNHPKVHNTVEFPGDFYFNELFEFPYVLSAPR